MKLEDKLLSRIDELSDKINKISDGAWESLVNYEWLIGLFNVIIGIVLVVIATLLTIHCIKQYKKGNPNNENNFITKKKEEIDWLGHTVIKRHRVPIKKSYMYYNDEDEKASYNHAGELTPVGWIMIIVTFLVILFALPFLFYGIPMGIIKMINPEIFAIKEILEQMKG